MRLTNQKGFTLIELVIIIVVLGILAAVAIPRYQDITAEAKEASGRAALGALRSGITIFYANKAVTTGTATWPTLAQLAAVDTVTNPRYRAPSPLPDRSGAPLLKNSIRSVLPS